MGFVACPALMQQSGSSKGKRGEVIWAGTEGAS